MANCFYVKSPLGGLGYFQGLTHSLSHLCCCLTKEVSRWSRLLACLWINSTLFLHSKKVEECVSWAFLYDEVAYLKETWKKLTHAIVRKCMRKKIARGLPPPAPLRGNKMMFLMLLKMWDSFKKCPKIMIQKVFIPYWQEATASCTPANRLHDDVQTSRLIFWEECHSLH
jgi:hypothetical protein